jgi:hypothetical protein
MIHGLMIEGGWINLAQVALVELYPPRLDGQRQIPPTVIFRFVDSQTKIVHGIEAVEVITFLTSLAEYTTDDSAKTRQGFMRPYKTTKEPDSLSN